MAIGKKTGGRQKGSKNKIKATEEIVSHATMMAALLNETPLQFMLRIMHDQSQEMNLRVDMAKASAPYVHAKLAAIQMEHSGKVETDRSSDELRNEILEEIMDLGLFPSAIGLPDEPLGVANRKPGNGTQH